MVRWVMLFFFIPFIWICREFVARRREEREIQERKFSFFCLHKHKSANVLCVDCAKSKKREREFSGKKDVDETMKRRHRLHSVRLLTRFPPLLLLNTLIFWSFPTLAFTITITIITEWSSRLPLPLPLQSPSPSYIAYTALFYSAAKFLSMAHQCCCCIGLIGVSVTRLLAPHMIWCVRFKESNSVRF